MKEFMLTSPSFSGFLKFAYRENKELYSYEENAVLGSHHKSFIRKHFPWTQDKLHVLGSNTAEITEVTDLSFDRFWQLYNYKKDRASAERYWAKMKDIEKGRALSHVKRYRNDCAMNNREMLYAVRYLRNRRYMDE